MKITNKTFPFCIYGFSLYLSLKVDGCLQVSKGKSVGGRSFLERHRGGSEPLSKEQRKSK